MSLCAPSALEDEAAEEAQRWLVGRGVPREVREEPRLRGADRRICSCSSSTSASSPCTRAQVEEDGRSEDRVGHRLVDPVRERALPLAQRLAPLGVGRHDVTRAPRVAAGDEPVDDIARQRLEPWRVRGRGVVADDEGVVLVAARPLLEAGLGPENHPGVCRRARPQLALGKVDETLLDGVADRGDDAADAVGGRVLVHELVDDAGEALAEGDERLEVVRLGDVADEVDRVGPLEAHEVGARQHAEGRAASAARRRACGGCCARSSRG